MTKSPIFSLFRAYSSKNNVSKLRFLLSNRFHLQTYPEISADFDGKSRKFSTGLFDKFQFRLVSRNLKVENLNLVDVRLFSSSLENGGDEKEKLDCVRASGELDLDYEVDCMRSIDVENVDEDGNRDLKIVEDGNDDAKENSVVTVIPMSESTETWEEGSGERLGFEHTGTDMTMSESTEKHEKGLGKSLGFENVGSRDPAEIYQELCKSEITAKHARSDWETLSEIFTCFARSGWASNQALAIYIGRSFFPSSVHKFRKFFFKKCPDEVSQYLVSLGPSIAAEKFIFPIYVEFCLEECQDEIKRFRSMIESADLTKPHTWFPFARAMKRKIVYHCGPTNSGKTYNALQRYMEAKTGIYCSPLRLLAMEVFDKVNANGVYCSLLTGQEKKYVPFSKHVACTVEMVSTDIMYDIAVIDEIQMIADPYRGYAWTRALLGLKADEIHLCGDPSVLNIVRKICSETGDELVENHYGRFKPLVVEAKTLLGDLKNVRSGDCVVAFSRREIFEVKLAIEKHTNHRCCVIYGALPPETRRQQASLFNDQTNEFDVLIASDAVGMGLNLNIRRVVFYSLAKYNGDKIVPVPASQVKQIAGRAGRRGSIYPDGLTTTLHLDDLDYLIECLKQPFDIVNKVGLFPFFEQVELFAGQLSNITFSQLLEKFGENCRLDGSYFLCRHDHIKKVANMLEKVQELSLEDRFNFCFAPVNIRDPKAMYHLLRFASSFSQKLPVSIAMGMPKTSATNDSELLDLETKHQVLSMYLWLSHHFKEETFPYFKKAEAMANDIAELLAESLKNASWKPESRQVGKPKTQQNAVGYDRPRSVIKLYEKKRLEKTSSSNEVVAA